MDMYPLDGPGDYRGENIGYLEELEQEKVLGSVRTEQMDQILLSLSQQIILLHNLTISANSPDYTVRSSEVLCTLTLAYLRTLQLF